MPITKSEEAAAACDMLLTALTRLTFMSGSPESVSRAAQMLREYESECLYRLSVDGGGAGDGDEDSMMADVFRRVCAYLSAQKPRPASTNTEN